MKLSSVGFQVYRCVSCVTHIMFETPLATNQHVTMEASRQLDKKFGSPVHWKTEKQDQSSYGVNIAKGVGSNSCYQLLIGNWPKPVSIDVNPLTGIMHMSASYRYSREMSGKFYICNKLTMTHVFQIA